MSDLEPMTPPECDLQDFAFMPLDVRRLRDSDLAAHQSPEACWAALLLWSAAWHQVPAASLPDDDRVLANLAGYGRVVSAWKKVRAGALHGFVRCSDGRLYHPVVAEKALEGWQKKQEQRWRTECARIKKANQRNGTDLPTPTFDEWKSGGVPPLSPGTDPDCPSGQREVSPDCPEGNGIQGTGRGTGRYTPPEGAQSAMLSPPPPDPNREAWTRGPALLVAGGAKPPAAKSLMGKLLRDHHLEPRDLLPAIVRCEATGSADPASYLRAAARALQDRRPNASTPKPLEWDEATWRIAVGNWRDDGSWSERMGPPPGQPGCFVHHEILAEFGIAPIIQLRREA